MQVNTNISKLINVGESKALSNNGMTTNKCNAMIELGLEGNHHFATTSLRLDF